jgi:hypothetical protein
MTYDMLAMTQTMEAAGNKESIFDKRMHAGLRNKENVVLNAARNKENMALDKRVLEVVSNKENIPPPNSPTVHRRLDRKRTPLADISAADGTGRDMSKGTTPKRTFVIYDVSTFSRQNLQRATLRYGVPNAMPWRMNITNCRLILHRNLEKRGPALAESNRQQQERRRYYDNCARLQMYIRPPTFSRQISSRNSSKEYDTASPGVVRPGYHKNCMPINDNTPSSVTVHYSVGSSSSSSRCHRGKRARSLIVQLLCLIVIILLLD